MTKSPTGGTQRADPGARLGRPRPAAPPTAPPGRAARWRSGTWGHSFCPSRPATGGCLRGSAKGSEIGKTNPKPGVQRRTRSSSRDHPTSAPPTRKGCPDQPARWHPEAPIWRYHHGATARRSGADDLCSRSGALRVFAGCSRSTLLCLVKVLPACWQTSDGPLGEGGLLLGQGGAGWGVRRRVGRSIEGHTESGVRQLLGQARRCRSSAG
jgi:hypothetical protein